MLLYPFSNDQFAWAHRAFDLGVRCKPIYKKDLTADKLADGIAYALNKDIVDNSKTLSEKIFLEHGALDSAKVILNVLQM